MIHQFRDKKQIERKIVYRNEKTFLDSIGEETRDYLRTEVPNILFAHKNIFILEPGYRKDANHIKFVLEAEHAFGEIFYKEKEKTTKAPKAKKQA